MGLRNLLASAAVITAGLAGVPGASTAQQPPAAQPAARPNILVIFGDDVGPISAPIPSA